MALLDPLKRRILKGIRTLGYDVTKRSNAPIAPVALSIDVVLDVGANTGQYARRLREDGYRNRIVSFEPLPSAYLALRQNARRDERWLVHERCALGAFTGNTDIHEAGNSESSSLLAMLPAHEAAAPDSAYVGTRQTPITTLDAVFNDYVAQDDRCLLKIDTQGYEHEVLAGAVRSLSRIAAVEIELSIVPLYDSQRLYPAFFDFFRDAGFTLWSLSPVYTDPGTGQLLQFDALFVRPEEPARSTADGQDSPR